MSLTSKVLEKAIENVDQMLLDCDEQMTEISTHIKKFVRDWQGDSIIVSGPLNSGRYSALKQCIDKNKKELNGVNLIYLDINQMGSDANGLQTLVENVQEDLEEEKPKKSSKKAAKVAEDCRLIVVRSADELAARSKQILLYKLLNATRNKPWLVFLIVDRQDFLSVLEKRVRSRFTSKMVQFQKQKPDGIRFKEHFYEFLYGESSCSAWTNLCTAFLKSKEVDTLIEFMHEADGSMDILKRVAILIQGYVYELLVDKRDITVDDLLTGLREAVSMVIPTESEEARVIKSLSTRSLCLLLCVMRRARSYPNPTTDIAFSYKKIITDYKHLSNSADARMRVDSDIVLYKELERLIELQLLDTYDAKNNNLAFKRIVLCCDPQNMREVLEECSIPSYIRDWYHTQPTN